MNLSANTDEIYMSEAIAEACVAKEKKEVPIGAVAVSAGEIIARAHNERETAQNPFGHAEIILIDKVARLKKSWRLSDVTIYVTCEPCVMCAGALVQARVPKVVFGCMDPKAGAMGSLYDISNDPRLNHRIEVVRGVLEKECAALLSEFFKGLRRA